MPVRRIGPNYRTNTGFYPLKRLGDSIEFESNLERDFLVLVDFDRDVASVEEQPVKIYWWDKKGHRHRYTPDFLIKFHPPNQQNPKHQPGKLRPWLVEVKDCQTLQKEWENFRPAFRAAVAHAHERGWSFHLMTENRIRTPILQNAHLLLPAVALQRSTPHCNALLQALQTYGELTVGELAAAVCPDTTRQTPFFQMIWWMLAEREIGTDLSLPLGMNTRLRLPDAMPARLLTKLYR